MTTNQRWSKKEDRFLVDTIIRHIKVGDTQRNAFEHASKKLGRSVTACAYRWNSTLRKDNLEEIDRAKEIGSGRIIEDSIEGKRLEEENPIKTALNSLQELDNYFFLSPEQVEEYQTLKEENKRLKEKISQMASAWKSIMGEESSLVEE